MSGPLATVVLVLALARAPFQCASDPDPNRRREDTPSEALWELAERFHERGDDDARRVTLEALVERYPTSREAERARLTLGGREADDEAASEASSASEAPRPERETEPEAPTRQPLAPETPEGS